MDPGKTDVSRRVRTRLARRIGRFLGVSDLSRSLQELRSALDVQTVELEILRARLEGVADREALLERQVPVWVTTAYVENTPAPDVDLITVVLPTHDRAGLIGRAVESVLAQSYANWELIVVDDGSEDDTPEALAGFTDQRIRVLRQDNRGPAGARNSALAQATGEYVVYIDDDNVMHRHWLRAVAIAFQRHPDAEMVIGAQIVDDGRRNLALDQAGPDDRGPIPRGGLPQLTAPSFDRDWLQINNVADIQQIAHRRVLPEAHFDEHLQVAADWDLIARLTRDRDPSIFPALAGIYTTSASSRLMESRERFGEFERVREKISAAVAADRPTAEHRITSTVADAGGPGTPGPADAPE